MGKEKEKGEEIVVKGYRGGNGRQE